MSGLSSWHVRRRSAQDDVIFSMTLRGQRPRTSLIQINVIVGWQYMKMIILQVATALWQGAMSDAATILVLGLGNTLLSDDGVGVHVVAALQQSPSRHDGVSFVDGGTIGLNLLPDVEAADGLILVDASEIGAPPGSLAVFEGAAMDAQLGGKKRTPHEVAAFDLIATASMLGRCPSLRALVAVQPQSVSWGLEPTAAVAAAVPGAIAMVLEIVQRWRAQAAGSSASSGSTATEEASA